MNDPLLKARMTPTWSGTRISAMVVTEIRIGYADLIQILAHELKSEYASNANTLVTYSTALINGSIFLESDGKGNVPIAGTSCEQMNRLTCFNGVGRSSLSGMNECYFSSGLADTAPKNITAIAVK